MRNRYSKRKTIYIYILQKLTEVIMFNVPFVHVHVQQHIYNIKYLSLCNKNILCEKPRKMRNIQNKPRNIICNCKRKCKEWCFYLIMAFLRRYEGKFQGFS